MTTSKVFFAYTRDGHQFDSIEALSPEAAHADITLSYKGETNFVLRGESVDISKGFRVEEVPVPVGLYRNASYWSHRMACCAEPGGPNGKWVYEQFSAAYAAMVRHAERAAPPTLPGGERQ